MDIPSLEIDTDYQTDRYPLLNKCMESCECVIDITRNNDVSSSSSHDEQPPRIDPPQQENRLSSNTVAPAQQTSSSSTRLNSSNSTSTERGDGYGHRRSPLNSGLWISVELVVAVSQIIASVVVLSLSRNEKPQAPLFAWVVGYASGCVATLPILYWRYHNRNRVSELESDQSRQGSSQSNPHEPMSYTAVAVAQGSNENNHGTTDTTTRNSQFSGTLSTRLNGLLDHFKMALDCFFAVWFVVGNVWIFGGHSSPSDAPKLYRLCIVFLTFSCIGYAMPFILCATICCCLPCIISVMGLREDLSQTRGANSETINALPTYKFVLKKSGNRSYQDSDGGILAAGTEKERIISAEDAVCCICLAKYEDNDELRELPCLHVFHVKCVDTWLKINAMCPLCKCEVAENNEDPTDSSEH